MNAGAKKLFFQWIMPPSVLFILGIVSSCMDKGEEWTKWSTIGMVLFSCGILGWIVCFIILYRKRKNAISVVTSYWRGKDFCQELTEELQKNGFDFAQWQIPIAAGRLATVHFFGGMERAGRKQTAITVVLLEGIQNLEDCMAIEMSLQELRQRWYQKRLKRKATPADIVCFLQDRLEPGIEYFCTHPKKYPYPYLSCIMVGYEKDTRRLCYARGEDFVMEGFASASACIERYFVHQDSIRVLSQTEIKG